MIIQEFCDTIATNLYRKEGDVMQCETVIVPYGDNCARYVLHNLITKRTGEQILAEKDSYCYCDRDYDGSISGAEMLAANVAFLMEKTPFYKTKEQRNSAIIHLLDQQEESLVHYKLVRWNFDVDNSPLPLISVYDSKRRVKFTPVTPFFKRLRRDVNKVGRFLTKHDPSGAGQKLLEFARNFYDTAKSLNLGRKLYNGFIFSYAHSKFCEKLGMTKTGLNRLLNLAAGLGLITKITPVEGKGIGEYWHKKYGVGTLQFRLDKLDIDEIEKRWLSWLQSGTKLHDVTLGKIRAVLGVDVETHPEAKDKELRRLVKEAIAKAAAEKEKRDNGIDAYNRTVHYDPFGLKHKTYLKKIGRQYSDDDARKILEDIVNSHNRRNKMTWFKNEDDPLLTPDTMVYYRVREGADKTRFLRKRYKDLPAGLLISEYQYYSSRNFAKSVISELYEQGLVAVVTKTRTDGKVADHTMKTFIQYVRNIKGGTSSDRNLSKKEWAAAPQIVCCDVIRQRNVPEDDHERNLAEEREILEAVASIRRDDDVRPPSDPVEYCRWLLQNRRTRGDPNAP